LIYLSHARLMLESEQALTEHANNGPPQSRRACAQVLSEPTRYVRWHVRHEMRMSVVANVQVRQRQILALRAFALEQIHSSALVRHLREHQVVGEARDRTLREFFGPADPRDAALRAHRDYLLAASSQVCATEVLGLADDARGVDLLNEYELAYGQFFSMFCESSRARASGETYLLSNLLPEVRVVATNLRRRILEGDSRRKRRSQTEPPPPPRDLVIASHKLVRLPAGSITR
jgi:hypothetical protein